MKRLRGVFELTVPEQRIIVVLLLAFVALVAVRQYREHPTHQRSAESLVAPSPSPGTRP